MSAAETDERTLPMTDTHYAVSIRRIYDAHTYMLEGYRLILWEVRESPDSCSGTRLSDRDAQPDTATNVG